MLRVHLKIKEIMTLFVCLISPLHYELWEQDLCSDHLHVSIPLQNASHCSIDGERREGRRRKKTRKEGNLLHSTTYKAPSHPAFT